MFSNFQFWPLDGEIAKSCCVECISATDFCDWCQEICNVLQRLTDRHYVSQQAKLILILAVAGSLIPFTM